MPEIPVGHHAFNSLQHSAAGGFILLNDCLALIKK